MTRVHDMGGRFGDGAIPIGDDHVFETDWHARALGLTLAAGALGQWNLDMSRHARESLPPKEYAAFGYYEKWLAALADLLVARGVISADELTTGAAGPSDLAANCMRSDQVAPALSRGGPSSRDVTQSPQFAIGDRVRTKRAENQMVAGGHTRLPRYAERVTGTVVLIHGAHVLPDSNAHGLGEAPEHLYTVAFAAADLWAHPENPADEVMLDLWQSYLEPA